MSCGLVSVGDISKQLTANWKDEGYTSIYLTPICSSHVLAVLLPGEMYTLAEQVTV